MRGDELTHDELLRLPVGHKDVAKGGLELWKQVFVLPSPGAGAPKPPSRPHGGAAGRLAGASAGKRGAGRWAGSGAAEHHNARQVALFSALERADVEGLIGGLHENYLSVGYPDPLLSRAADAAEHLSLHHVRAHAQYTRGHFSLLPYGSFTALGIQHCCSVPHAKEPIRFPKAAAAHRARHRARSQLLGSWRSGLAASMASRYTAAALAAEVLPPLLSLLAPPFRNSASHLLSTEERQQLNALVDTMLAFGLKLRHSQQHDSSYSLALDPPLPQLLPASPEALADAASAPRPPGCLAAGAEAARPQLPSHIRQLLHAELQRQLLRRRHGAAHEEEGRPAATQPKPQPSAAQLSAAAAARLVQAPATPSGPVHRDIFGRTVAARGSRKRGIGADGADSPAGGRAPIHAAQVRYKFNAGVTDAVRRTVRVRDLL